MVETALALTGEEARAISTLLKDQLERLATEDPKVSCLSWCGNIISF